MGLAIRTPGFIDHVVNKKAEIIRVYLPPDANTLLSVTDHCLRSRNYVNVIVAGKQPRRNGWTWMRRSSIARPASAFGTGPATTRRRARCGDGVRGDVPTLETLAAVEFLRKHFPIESPRDQCGRSDEAPASDEHPHGLSDKDFDALFTTDKPIIFAFHGYPWLIHRLTYRRTNHENLHVRGYKEEGTTTTPFDMVVLNDLDRFHLVAMSSIACRSSAHGRLLKQDIRDKLIEHKQYIAKHGEDMPEIRDWKWSGRR